MRLPFAILLPLVTALAFAQTGESRYRLQVLDALEVHYRYTPEYDQTVTIQPDGFVNLQIVGDIRAAGLTSDEVQAAILDKARLRLREPEVTVVVKDFQRPYFVVGGEVASPGRFEMRGRVTALEAIAMAGGFKHADAKHSQVILFRRAGSDLAQTELLDLKAAASASSKKPLEELRSGDLLVVPQNRISKIERFVRFTNIGLYWNPIP
ncbi:MAG TPA: polysaccharide biosynthesis/export family protein [Bryobacteraceae bacterium]|nr:polysaccharide biosynthesis/export family protein [Bryobacteraceae bacterium]